MIEINKQIQVKKPRRERNILNLIQSIYQNPTALAGVAQWTEFRPADQEVTGSISDQGPCLGCRPGPQ